MIKIGNNLSEWSSYSCQPKTKKELEKIIEERISKEGTDCDLNDIDVSLIMDMSYLFYGSKLSEFNGNISEWDVSNVKDMRGMFAYSNFNQDISNWILRKDCNVNHVFEGCPIEEEIEPKTLQL